jgi:tetratricopeptide (TPR) repeat protein
MVIGRRLVAVAVLAAAACSPGGRPGLAPARLRDEAKLEEANRLRERGSYVSLKEALAILDGLSGSSFVREAVLAPRLETTLLLAVRGKELGIDGSALLAGAERLLRDHRSLARLKPFLDIAVILPLRTKGILTDIDNSFTWFRINNDLKPREPQIRAAAVADEVTAYLYAAWVAEYFDADRIQTLKDLFKLFPASRIIAYKAASSIPSYDSAALQTLVERDPEYYEADFGLGQAALGQGLLLEAEAEFLKAYEGIPESPETRILLASIYFATEEIEKSLDFYDRTLEIAPTYRDAILGKAICLSLLGRNAEAIEVLERNLSLGYWLLGETHYWLAWNWHELKDNLNAAAHIEESKSRLGMSEVYSLSGTIQLESGDLARAEKDFREALGFSAVNTEALYGLGQLFAQKEDWSASGDWYLKAGAAFEAAGEALRIKISAIEGSPLPAERKEPLLRKKRAQLEAKLQARAAAFYLAAAAMANAGRFPDALGAAAKSAEHPLYKHKAAELAAQIKAARPA